MRDIFLGMAIAAILMAAFLGIYGTTNELGIYVFMGAAAIVSLLLLLATKESYISGCFSHFSATLLLYLFHSIHIDPIQQLLVGITSLVICGLFYLADLYLKHISARKLNEIVHPQQPNELDDQGDEGDDYQGQKCNFCQGFLTPTQRQGQYTVWECGCGATKRTQSSDE